MILRKDSGYVYEALEQDLLEQIRGGVLKPGHCVLSENELSAKYAISRVSVRRGLERLVGKGLLRRVPGKGTFVADPADRSDHGTGRKVLSFTVPDIEDAFISEIHRGVEEECNRRGFSVIVQSCGCLSEKENENLTQLKDGAAQGAIIFPNWGRFNTDTLFLLKRERFPFVLVDRYFRDLETDCVVVDNTDGACQAASHLAAFGHKRIAHISGVPCTANEDRLEGYRLGLAKAKIAYNPEWVRTIVPVRDANSARFEPDDVGGYQEARHLLALPERPTAIFAGNDYLALGAFKAIKEAGLRIPDDIALVGFDDLKFSALLEIPLTTVRQPKLEIGRQAAVILIDKILGDLPQPDTAVRQVVLKTELVIRASTKGADSGKAL